MTNLFHLEDWRDDRDASEWTALDGRVHVCDANIATAAYQTGWNDAFSHNQPNNQRYGHPKTIEAYEMGFRDCKGGLSGGQD